jgi:hypothetical protein
MESFLEVPYNQPRFGAFASWTSNAITIATSGTIGTNPYGMFVSINNTVYIANRDDSRVHIWLEGESVPTSNITTGLFHPFSVFATPNADIYVDNGNTYKRVLRWTPNGKANESVMFVKDVCHGLFVDIHYTVYCSIYAEHQVAAKSLLTDSEIWTVAAGTGCYGSTSNQLFYPRGIFVSKNLDLYVADSGNDRIQLFSSRQVTGVTVAGTGAPGTITLSYPTSVILDGDGYLFIADSYNHRIVASGPNGFRCLFACMGYGSASNQLNNPMAISFDSYGNLFVVDRDNNRVQKFNLVPNISTCKHH